MVVILHDSVESPICVSTPGKVYPGTEINDWDIKITTTENVYSSFDVKVIIDEYETVKTERITRYLVNFNISPTPFR